MDSLFYQTSSPHFDAVAAALKRDQATTCGLILTEVLHGARSEREQRILRGHFDRLPYCELHRADFVRAATLGCSLRRKGLTVKTVDLLLVHVALREDLVILHDDADFSLAARHTPLQAINPV